MNPFFLLAIAVAVSMVIIPLAIRLAPRIGMVDLPDPRKVHTKPVPRVGGWGIVLGSVVPIIIVHKFDPLIQSFVIGSLTLFLYGMWDDAKQISHWVKFSGQLFAVGLVVYYGGLYVTHFPFLGVDTLNPAVGKLFTVFAMMGMINAANHSDGLDGLAGGESMLSLMAIAFLGYIADDTLVPSLAFASMGGILGFLRYNTYPAQVFMGDSGSQYLGFSLGFLAVYLTQIAHPTLSPSLPLLFLGLPISDILAVLFQRIKGRMNWFRATRNHVHHRLLDLGFDHYETVVIIYSIQLMLVISAVLMRYQTDVLITGTYFSVIAVLFAGLIAAERSGWRAHRADSSPRLASLIARWKANSILRQFPLVIISISIPIFIVGGAFWVAHVPRDFGVVSGVLACVLAAEIALDRTVRSVIVRATIYVAAVFSAYLVVHYPGEASYPLTTIGAVMMGVLAFAIALFIRVTSTSNFGTTPTDYLIMFGVLAVALFGSTYIEARDTAQLVIYGIVLLYGCEVVIGQITSRWHIVNLSALLGLCVMALRGLGYA